MATRHIIPVAATARGKPGLVVEVKQTGSSPLHVRLAASEGENPYVTTLKQRDIGQLKKKAATDEEWEFLLSHFLLQEQPEADKAGFLEHVTMEYSPEESGNVQLVIRRDVQGIKQTLGQIELERDEDVEMDPVEWAFLSAQAHNEALKSLTELKAKLDHEQGTIEKLNAQLEDFIKTKNEAETAMLQQFMGLLNEKKRKIRDQNRILAGAKVDPSVATAVQSAREETKPRKAGPSRTSKRKAPVKKVADLKEDSDEDQMEIDESKAEEQNDDETSPGAATPDRSADEETETEDEDSAPPPCRAQEKSKSKSTESGPASAGLSQRIHSPPPPRRELPFSRRRAAQKQPSPPPADDDDDTEDEL